MSPTAFGPVEYIDDGSGPVLLSLHGGIGGCDQSLLLARSLFAAADRRRILALSRPGYLGTPLASGATPSAQADLYAALLDHVGIDRATVAAVAAGGPSALAFAIRHTDRCSGLILASVASGPLVMPPAAKRALPMFKVIARVPGAARLMGWLKDRNPYKAAARSIPDPALRRRTLAHQEAGRLMIALQKSIYRRLAERLPGTLADMAAFETLGLSLGAIIAPTLIIHGTADRTVPFEHARRIADAVSGAEFLAVDGGEHVSLFTHLDIIRARVIDFVEQTGA